MEGHAINTFVYCPRRCYYEYVERVFYHNMYTIHGKILHHRVDHMGKEHREEREIYRSLFVCSEQYRLTVRCDIVESSEGHIYPVEYKRGKMSNWENNKMQLCAQALALEDTLQCSIPYGYLFFYGSYQRKKIDFDLSLRNETIGVIKEIQDLYRRTEPPEGINDWTKCKKCSLVDYCLPMDRMKLKGKIEWGRFI
ncbi:CRISPR-associated protein Cas4 [Hazenella sp. IB182353]|uniref:CRISPR-associated protein Cas4 n=1 Tax=Polycladospora coralii TaxID=2771432 RepID=UPI001747265C|nr:CRISPR-associated protein Cas4 [Polycladospora coralii]